MSSDLPEARFRTGYQMASVLVTYLDDPQRVREAIRDEFPEGCKLGLSEIRAMRKAHLESLIRTPETHKPHEGYYPADVFERAIVANKRFVEALERERALSVERAKRQGALHSPSLRKPEIVNQAWDREIEAARRANTEFGR